MLSTEMNDQSDPNHLAAAAEQRASAEGSHLAVPVGAAARACFFAPVKVVESLRARDIYEGC